MKVITETWKVIEDHPNYEVSDLGRVRSWATSANSKYNTRSKEPRMLKPNKQWKTEHLNTSLNARTYSIHGLVLRAFKGERPSLNHVCCHNDGNPRNNHILNLRWGTYKENEADKKIHGTTARGESNGTAKLKEHQIHQIREYLSIGATLRQIGCLYKVDHSTISLIKRKKTWSHV